MPNLRLTAFFAAVWAHEGMGTKDPLNWFVANGHEARKQLGAFEAGNDPYIAVEKLVHTSDANLKTIAQQRVKAIDDAISVASDPGHLYVNSNFWVGNKCGSVYQYSLARSRYELKAFAPNGICM